MKRRTTLLLCAALALTAGVATATAGDGGKSANAKLCQKGGYRLLIRSEDRSSFTNEEACVSYGAQGGTLKTRSQFDCEAIGGTYASGPNLTSYPYWDTIFFVCNSWPIATYDELSDKSVALQDDCYLEHPNDPGPNLDLYFTNSAYPLPPPTTAYITCGNIVVPF
jgi:hypothetical protein